MNNFMKLLPICFSLLLVGCGNTKSDTKAFNLTPIHGSDEEVEPFSTFESAERLVMSTKNMNSTAYTSWEALYDEEGINIRICFNDPDLYYGNVYDIGYDDNAEFIINTRSTSQVWDVGKSYHFLINGRGDIYFQVAINANSFGSSFDQTLGAVLGENLIVSHEFAEFDTHGFDGFEANVFIAYDLLGTNYEEGLGELYFCPAMRNTHNYGTDTIWAGYNKRGCNWARAASFVQINYDGTFGE